FEATPEVQRFGVFLGLIVPLWCATGVILACVDTWLSKHIHPLIAAGVALLAATAGCTVISAANARTMSTILGHPPLLPTIFVFDLWNVLLLGGALLAALAAARRAARASLVVASGEIARNRDEARLRDVDLQDLRGQLSPALLLLAVSELKRRYAA